MEPIGTRLSPIKFKDFQAPYEPWSYNFMIMIMIIIMIRAMSIVLVMVMITFRIMTMIKAIVVFFF